jgi:hypothetical protein
MIEQTDAHRGGAGVGELSPEELAHIVEFGEAEAYASMCEAADPAAGLQAVRFGTAVMLLAPAFPVLLLNRVLGLGVGQPATEPQVDAIIDLYRANGSSGFAFQLSPAARPAELPGWLLARGLGRAGNWAKMIRRATPAGPVPSDLRIRPAGAGEAESFAAVSGRAFRMPPDLSRALSGAVGGAGWRHYLAFDGDLPVASAALFVWNGIGWMGADGTLPSHRRRGAQGALMARRINDAGELGCRWLITETDEDTPDRPNTSYHNMVRTGFALAYQRPNYVWSPQRA